MACCRKSWRRWGPAGAGAAPSYGEDAATIALAGQFAQLFERELAMFPVLTGTAANALALATLVPPHGAILCHEASHIMEHECGAPEFFTHGAKLIGLRGRMANSRPRPWRGRCGGCRAAMCMWPSPSRSACPSPPSWARSIP